VLPGTETEETDMQGTGNDGGIYFTLRDLGIILVLSAAAFLTGAVVPSVLFPEGRISDFVYATLALPGPGAGVLIFGGILCFWLLAGMLMVRKTGTAVAVAVGIIAFDLLFGNQVIIIQTMDVLIFVALIVEALCLIRVFPPWSFLLPGVLALFSVITLLLALTGHALAGEADTVITGIPYAWYVLGIAGICSAVISYRYPVRCIVAACCANMYYVLHFWLFWGDGIASRFPPDPWMVPVLLLVGAMGGFAAAIAVYGAGAGMRRYGPGLTDTSKDQ
jgi:hypothetical protein